MEDLSRADAEAIRQTLDTAIAASRRRIAEAQLLQSVRAGLRLLDEAGDGTAVEAPSSADHTHRLDAGGLHIDLRAHEVRRDGVSVGLSPTEFNLLVALASRPGELLHFLLVYCVII